MPKWNVWTVNKELWLAGMIDITQETAKDRSSHALLNRRVPQKGEWSDKGFENRKLNQEGGSSTP